MHKQSRSNIRTVINVTVLLIANITTQAQAFCIYNNTDSRLFFMVEPSSLKGNPTISFQKWIDAGKYECCDWKNNTCNPAATQTAKMSFYAFDAEDALEGCDKFGTASSDITLNAFIQFDRCHWGK